MDQTPRRKILLYELNEVPFAVLDWWAAARPRSQLARARRSLREVETLTADRGKLSPWITWPTLHRGVGNEQHGIANFGEDLSEADRKYPPVWKILSENGLRCGVFNSLHSYPLPEDLSNYDFFVPDPFAPDATVHPPELGSFQDLNLAMSRASARNVDRGIPWKPAARFVLDAPRLGLRPGTPLAIVRQLASERLNPARAVRRRTFQSVLGFDFFLHQMKKHQPDFASYFTNHVASAMHRFWAATFPGDYQEFELSDAWTERYGDELAFAMEWCDRFFGRLLGFVRAHPEYLLLVASSMGQAATKARRASTQFQLVDLGRFMQALGIPGEAWESRPAMFPDVNFVVKPEHQELVREKFAEVEVIGRPLRFGESAGGFFHLVFGGDDQDVSQGVRIAGAKLPVEEAGFRNLPVESGTGSSNAYHVPEGSLLIFDPQLSAPARGRPQHSVLELAPGILRSLGVEPPEYMQRETALRLA